MATFHGSAQENIELAWESCGWKGCIMAVTPLHRYQHHQHSLLAASVIYQITRHAQPQILSSSKKKKPEFHILFVAVH